MAYSVESIDRGADEGLVACIESPRVGDGCDGYALAVSGWVLSREERDPAGTVSLTVEGGGWGEPIQVEDQRWTLAPATVRQQCAGCRALHGLRFLAGVGTLGFPHRFSIRLWMQPPRPKSGIWSPLARIRLTKPKAPSQNSLRRQPIVLNALGRTGSTWTMRLLSQHPGIVATPLYPYEDRSAGVWMHMLKVLSSPRNAISSMKPINFDSELGFIGHHPFNTPTRFQALPSGSRLQRWFGKAYVEDLIAFCLASADSYYHEIAAAYGKEASRYFVEKFEPLHIPNLVWELYPHSKEIILIRDFRDVFCSARAFNRKRGFKAFGEEAAGGEEDWIVGLGRRTQTLYDRACDPAVDALLVRYEDLILEPVATVRRLLDYLGLESDDQRIDRMLTAARTDTAELKGHRTTEGPKASVQRWRTDLDEKLLRLCDRHYAKLLSDLEYPRE